MKKHERIWQTGSQQRSEFTFHRGAELVRNGVLGKITSVEVGLPQGRSGHKAGDALANEIKEHAAKTLPRFKRPQRIHFMEALPRTATPPGPRPGAGRTAG